MLWEVGDWSIRSVQGQEGAKHFTARVHQEVGTEYSGESVQIGKTCSLYQQDEKYSHLCYYTSLEEVLTHP